MKSVCIYTNSSDYTYTMDTLVVLVTNIVTHTKPSNCPRYFNSGAHMCTYRSSCKIISLQRPKTFSDRSENLQVLVYLWLKLTQLLCVLRLLHPSNYNYCGIETKLRYWFWKAMSPHTHTHTNTHTHTHTHTQLFYSRAAAHWHIKYFFNTETMLMHQRQSSCPTSTSQKSNSLIHNNKTGCFQKRQ